MNAGDLRHSIIIQIPQRVKNSIGEWYDSWTTWATVYAAIEPLSGKRYMEGKQANSDVTGIVRIRYRAGVIPTMRLLYGSRILQIVSIVDSKEKHEEIQIYYREQLD